MGPEEAEAEMKKMREQQARFREEMRQRAEDAKRKRIEEKAREKERKKEEKRLIAELMNDWSKKRDDLECEDLKELPKPTPVHCKVPNQLFGDFLMVLEFLHSFYDILEVKDSYPSGVSFSNPRDEIDTRLENMIDAKTELREATFAENRRIKEDEAAEKQRKKEERMKMIEERLKAEEQIRKNREEKLKADENKDEKKEEEENKENKEDGKEEKKEMKKDAL